jgi:hypothetical protein
MICGAPKFQPTTIQSLDLHGACAAPGHTLLKFEALGAELAGIGNAWRGSYRETPHINGRPFHRVADLPYPVAEQLLSTTAESGRRALTADKVWTVTSGQHHVQTIAAGE